MHGTRVTDCRAGCSTNTHRKRTPRAEVRTAVDMANAGAHCCRHQAIQRVSDGSIERLLHPQQIDPMAKREILTRGLGAALGHAATGEDRS